jgi:hypothetical protein
MRSPGKEWAVALLATSPILWICIYLVREIQWCSGGQDCLERWGEIPLDIASTAVVITTIATIFMVWKAALRHSEPQMRALGLRQAAPIPVSHLTPADAKLLEIIRQFKPPTSADGTTPGTPAAKVHDYLHACGVPEDRVSQAIDSAVNRKIITRVTGPGTANGVLYFEGGPRK